MASLYDELYTPLSFYIMHNSAGSKDKTATEAKKEKPQKKEVINKSSLIIEIKPSREDVDLEEVLKKVKEIKLEGLTWGSAYKKLPFAYGIFKLQVSCVIIDDLVNTDDIVEQIESIGLSEVQSEAKKKLIEKQAENEDEDLDDEDDYIEGLVQSAEIISFNKL